MSGSRFLVILQIGYSRHSFPDLKMCKTGSQRSHQTQGPTVVAEELELESGHWNCALISISPGLPSIWLSSQLLAASPTTLVMKTCAGSEKAPRLSGGCPKNGLQFLSRAQSDFWGLFSIPRAQHRAWNRGILSKRVLKQVNLWCCKLSTPELWALDKTIAQGGCIRDPEVHWAFSFFFFFFKFYSYFIYLFIYFWLCWVFGPCEGFLQLRQVGATLHRGAGTALHRGARAPHHRGPPRRGAQAPDAQAQAQQSWPTGPAAPRHVGSSQTRARTRAPCISRQTLNHCATREAQ